MGKLQNSFGEEARPEQLGKGPGSLQLLPLTGTNEDLPLRRCVKCERQKPVAEFYRKRDGYERRCRKCVLAIKARAYKAKRAKPSMRRQQEVIWYEIIESPSDEKDSSVKLDALLRDFMLDVILDAT